LPINRVVNLDNLRTENETPSAAIGLSSRYVGPADTLSKTAHTTTRATHLKAYVEQIKNTYVVHKRGRERQIRFAASKAFGVSINFHQAGDFDR
jgi:hypothetical protein